MIHVKCSYSDFNRSAGSMNINPRDLPRNPYPDRPECEQELAEATGFRGLCEKRAQSADTTPRYWGFQLLNPATGELVFCDDCQHTTGMMVEAKGGYSGVLAFQQGRDSVSADWLHQSAAQLAAASGRPIRWYFAEPETKAFAEKLFRSAGGGRDRIETQILPWPGSGA
jgi:hypothetical protein